MNLQKNYEKKVRNFSAPEVKNNISVRSAILHFFFKRVKKIKVCKKCVALKCSVDLWFKETTLARMLHVIKCKRLLIAVFN